MKNFTMSMFATTQDLYKAKAEYYENVAIELYKLLYHVNEGLIDSGHGTAEEVIAMLDKYEELV